MTILEFYSPSVGIIFPTDTEARYTLIDRATDVTLFKQTAVAQQTTPVDFAFFGAVRARDSMNWPAQNNIAGLLDAIECSSLALSPLTQPAS